MLSDFARFRALTLKSFFYQLPGGFSEDLDAFVPEQLLGQQGGTMIPIFLSNQADDSISDDLGQAVGRTSSPIAVFERRRPSKSPELHPALECPLGKTAL